MIRFVTKKQHQVVEESLVLDLGKDLQEVIDYCKDLPVVGFDTETTGLDPYLSEVLLIILGDNELQYVVDSSSYTKDELRNLFISIGLDKLYLGQNLKFDYKFAKVHYDIEIRNLYDLMIAEQRLLQGADLSFRLDEIIKRRLKTLPEEMNKDVRKEFVGANPEAFIFKNYHITYAAGDIKYLFPVKVIQDEKIAAANQGFLINDIEFPLISILGDAELVGFVLDEDKWQENIKINKEKQFEYQCKLDDELRSLRDKLCDEENKKFITGGKYDRVRRPKVDAVQYDLFGEPLITEEKANKLSHVNYASTDVLVNLFGRLRQPAPTKLGKYVIPEFIRDAKGRQKVDKSGNSFTTGAGVIEGYLLENPSSPMHNFIKHLVQFRKATVRINTFGDKFVRQFKNSKTGKVHTIFRQCNAVTGRLQSGDKKNGWFNSQNIPAKKEYREAFRTDPNRLIATTDLSGAEAVIMIDKAKDDKFYEIAIVNDDAHSPLAQAVWRAIGEHRMRVIEQAEPLHYKFSPDWNKARVLSQIIISKTENKDMRTGYKANTFGDIYGMHDKKRAKTLNISIEEAKIAGRVQKSMLPKTYAMVERNAKLALANGYIVLNTRTNSRIWYTQVFEARKNNIQLGFMEQHDIESSARNSPIQGTQADMVKECMVEIHKEIVRQSLDIRLLGQVHDELIYDFHKKHMTPDIEYFDEQGNISLVDAGDFIKFTMIKVCNRYLSFIKISAEQHIGETWTK